MELSQVRDQLQMTHPVVGWIYVGAGVGTDLERCLASDVTYLLAIEASQEPFARLEKKLHGNSEWICRRVLVTPDSGEGVFYHASNAKESALIPPEQLRFLWRNLEARDSELLESQSLADIIQEHQDRCQGRFNWMTIDCFPAADILKGSEGELRDFDVIEVRALNVPDETGPFVEGMRLEACRQLLSRVGFIERVQCEEPTPGVVRAFFVRDWRRLARELEITAQGVQAELSVANELIGKQTSELGAQRQNNAELTSSLEAQSVARVVREAESKKLVEYEARIDGLTNEKIQLEAEIGRLSDQRMQQQQVQLSLEKQVSSLSAEALSAQKSADEAKQNSREAKEIIKRFENEILDSDHKIQLLRQELLMAEAQMNFVKDLLLSGRES